MYHLKCSISKISLFQSGKALYQTSCDMSLIFHSYENIYYKNPQSPHFKCVDVHFVIRVGRVDLSHNNVLIALSDYCSKYERDLSNPSCGFCRDHAQY